MKQRLTGLAFTALAVVAMISAFLTIPAPALADGATQISGVGYFDDTGQCTNDAEGDGSDFALRMTGDLDGCLYVFVEDFVCRPSGTYREVGTETFVGQYNGETGTFKTNYQFAAKLHDCPDLATEIFGSCQHPIEVGSGTGYFEGVSGRFNIKDDVEAGNYPYRGHLRW